MGNMEDKMEVIDVDVKKLVPYENNPRQISADAINAVANSIKEFGFKQPLVVDDNNTIIVGHTRLLAAKKLKLKTVPVVVSKDLTPEQVKAYRLADNKTGELTDWQFEELENELEGIETIDMSQLGFEQAEYKDDDAELGDYTVPESNDPLVECPECHATFLRSKLKKVDD